MITLTRTDALYAAWAIEKGHLDRGGWNYLQEGLDLPVGSPRAQIKSVLEQCLRETDPQEEPDGQDEDQLGHL